MDNLADLIDDLVSDKPDASPFAQQIMEDENEPANDGGNNGESPAKTTTGNGAGVNESEVFDPMLHCVDASGNPVRTKSGKLRRKRGKANHTAIDTSQANQELACKNAAIVTVKSIVLLGYAIGGEEEWKPEENEMIAMNMAWTDYYMSQGIMNLPPWLGIVIATGAYAAPRLSKPKTSSRLKEIFGGVSRGLNRMKKWFSKGKR